MTDVFYEKIDNISNKEPSEIINAMKEQDNITNYYRLLIKEEKITVQLRTTKGKYIPYDINIKDPLILLRFFHQARNSKATKSGNWDKMELYLIEENGNVIKKVEATDTIVSLKQDTSLADNPLYFSFKLPDKVKAQQGGKKRKRKKKKKKKAFPSRKKNNRKNRTKKKALSK